MDKRNQNNIIGNTDNITSKTSTPTTFFLFFLEAKIHLHKGLPREMDTNSFTSKDLDNRHNKEIINNNKINFWDYFSYSHYSS